MKLEDKIEILIRDFGLDLILEQNDLTEEDVLTELIRWGLVDTEDYFYQDMVIANNDD